MNIDELARVLSRVATDAVLDVLPEAVPREWEIDQMVREALLKHLFQRQAIAQARQRTERQQAAQRQRRRLGGRR